MKKIIYAVLGFIVVVAIVITFMIDSFGKQYAQEFAQKLLKTPVSIGQFDTSFSDKSLNIDFVEVRNPAGFKNKNALSLDHFSLKVGGEMFSDLIEIELLKFDGLEFVLEQGSGGVNLTKILDNLENQSSENSASSADSGSSKRIKIKRFLVENITLKIDTSFLKTTLDVPNISTNDFGGSAGVSVDEIGKQIVKEVLDNLQIKKALFKKLGDKLGLDGIADKLGFGSSTESTDTKNLLDTDKLKDKAKGLLKGFGF